MEPMVEYDIYSHGLNGEASPEMRRYFAVRLHGSRMYRDFSDDG